MFLLCVFSHDCCTFSTTAEAVYIAQNSPESLLHFSAKFPLARVVSMHFAHDFVTLDNMERCSETEKREEKTRQIQAILCPCARGLSGIY